MVSHNQGLHNNIQGSVCGDMNLFSLNITKFDAYIKKNTEGHQNANGQDHNNNQINGYNNNVNVINNQFNNMNGQ